MPAGPEPMTAARRPDGGLALERQRRVDALVEHRLEDLVAGVAVAVADGDRLVDLVAPAVLLARGRADPAEDGRERDRPLEDPRALAPVGLGVGLEEARDVDVARALVLAGRQAVGVVVAEDQLEVRPAQAADLLGLGLDLHLRLARPRARDRRVLLALDLDDAHPAGAEAGQLGLVAEGRDLDAVVAADLEDRLALEALDDPAVDLDPDARRRLRPLRRLRVEQPLGERFRLRRGAAVGARQEVSHGSPYEVAPAATAIGWQTPAGQELRRRCSSSSDRKYRIPLSEREGRQALVVAQRGRRRCRPTRSASEVEVGRARPAVDDAVGDLDEPARPDPAGDRLAARLAGAEPGQQPGEVDDAGPVVGDDDRARADVGAGLAQRLEVVRRVERVGRQQAARRTADEDGLDRAAGRERAAERRRSSRSGVPSGTSAMPSPDGVRTWTRTVPGLSGDADRRERLRRRGG